MKMAVRIVKMNAWIRATRVSNISMNSMNANEASEPDTSTNAPRNVVPEMAARVVYRDQTRLRSNQEA